MKWVTYVLWRHEITSSVPWKRKGRCRFEVSREDVHKPGPYMPPRSPPRHNKNSSVFFLIPERCVKHARATKDMRQVDTKRRDRLSAV